MGRRRLGRQRHRAPSRPRPTSGREREGPSDGRGGPRRRRRRRSGRKAAPPGSTHTVARRVRRAPARWPKHRQQEGPKTQGDRAHCRATLRYISAIPRPCFLPLGAVSSPSRGHIPARRGRRVSPPQLRRRFRRPAPPGRACARGGRGGGSETRAPESTRRAAAACRPRAPRRAHRLPRARRRRDVAGRSLRAAAATLSSPPRDRRSPPTEQTSRAGQTCPVAAWGCGGGGDASPHSAYTPTRAKEEKRKGGGGAVASRLHLVCRSRLRLVCISSASRASGFESRSCQTAFDSASSPSAALPVPP